MLKIDTIVNTHRQTHRYRQANIDTQTHTAAAQPHTLACDQKALKNLEK